MSNVTDIATFIRMYKQWVESRNQHLEANPPLARSQHSTNQVQHPIPQHPSPQSRPQPYRQPPSRNPADISLLLQGLDDVKKRQDEIYVTLTALQAMIENIKITVDGGVEKMVGTMERFEYVGRGVLGMALQPSNSQPSNGNPPQLGQHVSQPPISSKTYQDSNTPQPPAPFISSSNPTQPLYAPPASQAPDSEPYIDYSGLEFLATS